MDKFTVRGADGSVDMAASTEAYVKSLSEWVAEHDVSNTAIEAALDNVFDKNPGRVPTQFLASLAARDLVTKPEAFASMKQRVHSYIKTAVLSGEKYTLLRGFGGGVARVSKSSD